MKLTSRKVVVVGTGFVGSSSAYAMINQGIINELILIDENQEKAQGEALDLLDGVAWGQENVTVRAGEYEECKDANIVVITAGINQVPNQTRLELVDINAKIMKSIVNNVMNHGFDGIFVIASNPVDIMTYVAWSTSGLHFSRVIGTGTALDTTRYKKEIAQKLAVDPRSVHGYIIGEHGDSEVPVWSHTTVGGKPILEFIGKDKSFKPEDLSFLADNVKNAAYEIINRKKATYYGIGMSSARIVKAILNNEQAVLPVSTYLQGEYSQEGVFTGVPAIVDQRGVREIIELNIDTIEKEKFRNSIKQLKLVIQSLD